MFTYLIIQMLAVIVAAAAVGIIIFSLVRNSSLWELLCSKRVLMPFVLLVIAGMLGLYASKTYAPQLTMPMFMRSHAPGNLAPAIPFANIFTFFSQVNDFEKVADISADPNAVPENPQMADADGIVHINLRAQEVIAEITPGVFLNYWTYNGQVPGPMLRIREGAIVEITLTNDMSSLHNHNIDLHAVTGPGGGAVLSNVAPGETKRFRFQALNPGLYIYHCAMANVSTHNSHGQYGLIMVDPIDPALALAPVDKEFYIVQGEFYTQGHTGKRGLIPFDGEALFAGVPNYVVFNGKIENTPRIDAKVGEKIRIYVGNGGVNLISSFHVIGEIFDTVYPEAAIGIGSALFKNVQTTAVLPGGAAIVEFTVDVPGEYILVDHALARMNKGAWAVLHVTGPENPGIFGKGASDTISVQ